MSDNKNINPPEKGQSDIADSNIVKTSEVSSIAGSVKTSKTSQRLSSPAERQIKFERAQRCLENAALVSKRIKEHRKATAELLGRPFEEDDGGDTASEMASNMSEKTGYSVATDTSTTLSLQDALNIPGISESLANTLKQKELLMERIKQYKEISKRPMTKPSVQTVRRESSVDTKIEVKKPADNIDVTQLLHTIKEKDNSLSVIQVKMKAMETTILDLQEKINEKDQIIEAKNKATTLMSDNLSKKEKDSFNLLEDTRQQMTKMQENFIAMETEWKDEKQKLIKEIEVKDEKINSLEEANSILEASRFEISIAHSKLIDELDSKNQEILSLQEKIENMSQISIGKASPKEKDDVEEEKGSLEIAGMVELTKKIELLEQLNCQIRQTNKELENKLANVNTEHKSPTASAASKKGSPLPTRKGGRNTASKSKSPWTQLSSESLPQETDKKAAKTEITRLEMLVQSLNKDILEKEYVISQKEVLIVELQSAIEKIESKVPSVTLDVGVSTDAEDNKDKETIEVQKVEESKVESAQDQSEAIKELEEKLKLAEEQIETLHKDMEAANLNMIKVKSAHKLKLKQLQKAIDSFSQVSDAHAEVVRVQQELQELTRKVAVLEEEKGNLQLHLVDYDSGRLTESDMYKKMRETEALSEARLKSISVLEGQKFDLVQELHMLQQKNMEMEDKIADISQLQSEHVCTEMKSVQMEEQIDELIAAKKELELIVENLKLDNEHLNESIKVLQEEKNEIALKLENYIQENIELTDKLEKLSAEKVSSAESIEIVESLTTQEKLELEEYNKGIFEGKSDEQHDEQLDENASAQNDRNIDSLIEQREELNKKIELFTQEREEVMEKMTKIKAENDSLLAKLTELNDQSSILETNIGVLNTEKLELQNLNQDLARQIEDLKRERIEIMKETADIAKSPIDDTTDGAHAETQHDDKMVGDKGAKGAKTVKQLTKEILKLKNTIKEREDEIADCQMKILSLEEQQQKQSEILQSNASNESKIRHLTEENYQLKQELEHAKSSIQQELQKVHQEYTTSVGSRDARINELENVLLEYEKQLFNYGNSLQQKDKEISEYINQVTKLNDVSQKLKSTIELLEEEKAKDQNAEFVKTLNKQISAYQKKLADNDDKIKTLEEEKLQLHCLKGELTNKNINLEAELKKLKDSFTEKQTLIKELQAQQQKHAEELSAKQLQTVERDEEIHEIKLQLRKESIENEKLRNSIAEKEKAVEQLNQQIEETKQSQQSSSDHFTALETKNRELMEKLKKAAISIKKKGFLFTELETNYNECQKQLSAKYEQIDQMLIQVETLPALQEKLRHADEEINRLQSQKVSIEQQRVQDLNQLQKETKALQERFLMSSQEISQLNDALNMLHKDLHFAREENTHLNSQIDVLNNKLVEHEIEQKNNFNLITKISSLEADINQKQIQIAELLHKIEHLEQQQTQVQYGYDAKVQEQELYIENLETEITKYKNRICRLEESISIMEDRRHSLERKADQLGSQLQEKQKAYTDYTSQEDELVIRLAALMDHDRVLDKQIFEIENENKELQFKVQHLTEDNQRLKKALSDYQEQNQILHDKASKLDSIEPELIKYQTKYHDLEANYKKVTNDYQSLIVQKKQEIEELETEFNTQIENAIKEKKILSEKYEKISEYVYQLETKLQEYKDNNETLNINITELNKVNQELIEKSSRKDESATPDYTEQYISEINRLNSVVSSKSNEIYELNNKMQTLQTNNVAVVTTYDSKISELTSQLNQSQSELERLHAETHSLQQANNLLHQELSQKEEQIKELRENKTLTFEMNIPKTEGMVISSTIEPFSDGSRHVDVSSLEAQIVSGIEEIPIEKNHDVKKVSESLVKQSASGEVIEEPIISPKKAYVCTKEEDKDTTAEIDPFNSDEGWGLGVNEDIEDVAPGTSHLHNQIEQLNKDNAALKSELQANNIKLLKALKKLKELKASNDVLTNELKTAKQMSQSAFFDNAIEEELRLNIKELEKKTEELTADITKEKRDKESLRKQNEVFHNANDRLTDMKEKLDNEVQLWKYKFQEANDKISTLQWGGDNKDVSEPQQLPQVSNMCQDKFKDELSKIEKENEELQGMVDQMNTFNKELLSQQTALQNEIANLNQQLQQHQQTCENCELIKKQIEGLVNDHDEFNKLKKEHQKLTEQLKSLESKYRDLTESYDILSIDNEELRSKIGNEKELQQIRHLTDTCKQYKNERTALIEKNQRLEDQLFRMEQLEKEKMTLLHTNNQLDEILRKFEGERSELLNTCRRLQIEVDKVNQYAYENAELTDRNTYLEVQLNDLTPLYTEAQAQLSRVVSELEDAKAKLLWHDEQQQASNTNSCALCNAMEEHCLQVKHNLDEANTKLSQLETKNQKLEQMCEQFKENIKELTTKIEHLNGENDNLLSTVAELRSAVSTAVDQRGFEIAELWKQHLSQRETDFQKIESDLRSQLTASEVKYEQLLENVQSSNQEETNKLVVIEQVNSLQNKLEDKEEHIRNLQNKYAEALNQLDMLRSEMEDEKVGYENKLLEQQEEYERMIQELTVKNQKHTESYEDTFKNIQSELSSYKTKNDELNEVIDDLKDKIKKADDKIEDLTNQIRMNESEIYQKSHDYTATLSQRNEEFENVRKQLIEYEKKIEELTYEKESELAVLRLKMHENESHYKKVNSESEIENSSLLEALNAKIIECTSLNKQIADLNRQLEEDASKVAEMQAALENQEIEIIGLKDEMDNLQDLLRSSTGKIQKHVSFASDTKLGSDAEQAEPAMNKDLLDAVPRAELDLALYMLHQRDVRCEELTMELTQLLEERDTLQLRLSDSLRSNEEMKIKFKAGCSDDTFDSSQETISELPSFSIEREFVDIHRGQTSRSSSISDPDGEKPKLQAKLSELRSVKHSRDVRFRQESEQRQLDLRLLQRDVANLPPEAVDQLAQAHHTLSRDSQSTSTVLLNWLRGKSTPKVVHM